MTRTIRWSKLGEVVPDVVVVRWLFFRLLAGVSCGAFASYYVQYPGLIGERGLLPILSGLKTVVTPSGWAYLRLPTLVWWVGSDAAVGGMALAGIGLSVLLFVNVAPRLVLGLLWVLHLSLVVAGQQFYQYQWDTLLTETLFLSLFFAPDHLLPRREVASPSWLSVWGLRLLLFKLMILAGGVKLLSGDSTWWGLTALRHHFETQPLPNPVAWYAHQLPVEMLGAMTLGVLVIELGVPLLMFGPRRLRLAAFYPLLGLQAAIVLTGNYGALNLLTGVLCLVLLDDEHLRTLRRMLPRAVLPRAGPGEPVWRRGALNAVLGVVFVLNVLVVGSWLTRPVAPGWTHAVRRTLEPFRTINTYGLFGTMTRVRREVVIQGSREGETWKSYRFPYKPGPPGRRPPWIVGHMPRLDWQMWFLALQSPRDEKPVWFRRLMKALLEGRRGVLALFATNPFPDRPPRYVRAVMYRYRLTEWGTNTNPEAWWTRDRRRIFVPPVTLHDGALRPAGSTR